MKLPVQSEKLHDIEKALIRRFYLQLSSAKIWYKINLYRQKGNKVPHGEIENFLMDETKPMLQKRGRKRMKPLAEVVVKETEFKSDLRVYNDIGEFVNHREFDQWYK